MLLDSSRARTLWITSHHHPHECADFGGSLIVLGAISGEFLCSTNPLRISFD